MSADTIKMPEQIMTPTTIMTESKSSSSRTKPVSEETVTSIDEGLEEFAMNAR
jgi:hypothetical protein